MKYKCVLLIALILIATNVQAQSALATLANSMQPGSWAELTTNNIGVFNQGGSSGNLLDYAGNASWDPINRKYVYVGNDHIDGNTSLTGRYVVYDEASNTWSQGVPPWSTPGHTDHGYNHMAIDQTTGTVYRRAAGNQFYKYNVATNTWTTLPPNALAQDGNACCESAVYFPQLGGFVYAQPGEERVYLFNVGTQTWSLLASGLTSIDYGTVNFGAIDDVHHIYVFGQDNFFYKLDSARAITSSSLAPFNFTDGSGFFFNVVADPVSGKFILLTVSARDLYSYDVTTNAWAAVSSINKPNLAYQDVISAPVSNYGVILYVACSGSSCKTYLYKHANGGTPPPTDTMPPTISLTAPAAGMLSGTVTVSANASDNVGVAGVQFKLDGVNLGAEDISSPYSVLWDTLTATNAIHALTATARDAAGNRTTSANVSVTVNNVITPPPSGTVTSFTLTSPVTQVAASFTVGLGFKQGDIPGTPVLSLSEQQVIVKTRWNDGSAKQAIASGHTALTANVASTVNVTNGTIASGTALTPANIQTANPQAAVQLGSIGTVNLSSLLATPFRTFISGPQMVEAHYQSAVGTDSTLTVWFHVRLYKNGKVWIRAVVQNGFLDIATSDKTYIPIVTIGGTAVYTNGNQPLIHYAHTRWTVEGWVGGDPQITPAHDTTYLMASKLVPNYWKRNPTATALNALTQTYVPMGRGDWTPSMGNTGYQSQIGLLPWWDSLYVTSADPRAFRSMIANAQSINSYPIIWTDSATKLPVIPSGRPTWTIYGPDQGGAGVVGTNGGLEWEVSHHGSAGYLAYLVTGDYYYLETMQHQTALNYLVVSSGLGSGTSRILRGQTRGAAWMQRTVGQLAALGPSGDVNTNDWKTLLANNVTYWKAAVDTPGQNLLGYIYSGEMGAYGPGGAAPWQQHFFVQTYGHISEIEPLANMTTLNAVRDHLYKSVVGILGPGGPGSYCFTDASKYFIVVAAQDEWDTANWYDNWETVHTATFGPSPACGNTLGGESGGAPEGAAGGYWGNLLPAIAYATEHGAPGAAAAWSRMTGATNWTTVENSGFNDYPMWGIVPRSIVTVPPPQPTNLAPTSNAGPDQMITLPAAATLVGTATDDGLPNGALTYQWSGPATFSAPTALATQAVFSSPGTYSVTLTVRDGLLSTSDSASVVVTEPPPTGDTIRPTIMFQTPNGASFNSNDVTVRVVATDNIAVTCIRLFRANNPLAIVTNCETPLSGSTTFLRWQAATIPKGTYLLTAYAEDASGNVSLPGMITVNRK